ncbi:MAG: 2-phosphoglycerate kinase [Gemmatimonadetes bacterium]|nr:2-phosphoglycerate kinase [Gemmatimonadota bacterium]
MRDAPAHLRVILIGGSSHSGKSALSESIATNLGWNRISTDTLARHPGRPWRSAPEKVPDHVAEHYLSLSVDELIVDVLHHYRVNLWPKVEKIVASHINDLSRGGLIIEGSALWPELVATLDSENIATLWLTASEEVFRQRIRDESLYHSKSLRERRMIDKFLERTLVYNAQMIEIVNRHGFILVDVQQSNLAELTQRCLSILRSSRWIVFLAGIFYY